MAFSPDFKAHLETGASTIARAWEVTRTDGERLGFTDHDQDLYFDGLNFSADAGLSAGELATTTGLSVDNAEAVGALSSEGLREEDIHAGRFDGAIVKAWLVNWASPVDRALIFKGSIGEINRNGAEFRAELRGLAEALNHPRGRVYQKPCSAVLGDSACQFDLNVAGFFTDVTVIENVDGQVLKFGILPAFVDAWFEYGQLLILDGAAQGLSRVIKADRVQPDHRAIELWESISAPIEIGDTVRLVAGCDKRDVTCKTKFSNFVNYQGFPTIPGEDWLAAYPRSGQNNDGGSLQS